MSKVTSGAMQLPADCDMQWARGFQEQMLERAALDHDIEIRADAVERMTTPAIQVLVALSRALEVERHRMMVRGASPAFAAAFTDLGLSEMTLHWRAS